MPTLEHGHNGRLGPSRTYRSWAQAKNRCRSSSSPHFLSYGGRGIAFSPAWDKFKDFLADMGERPEGMSLDRIDNDGDYEPGNCRWATRPEQQRNRRDNVNIEFNGKKQCMADWAKEYGMSREVLRNRLLVSKWSVELALTTPVRKKR